jgi:hypothetical protein
MTLEIRNALDTNQAINTQIKQGNVHNTHTTVIIQAKQMNNLGPLVVFYLFIVGFYQDPAFAMLYLCVYCVFLPRSSTLFCFAFVYCLVSI